MLIRNIIKQFLPWTIACIVLVPLFTAYIANDLLSIDSLYTIFPLLGLLAWGLLASQYFTETVRHLVPRQFDSNPRFARWSGIAILMSVLLHPVLLVLQLYIDTASLPPSSIESYVGSTQMYLIWIAISGLILFLLFDILRPYRRTLQKLNIWRYVSLAQVVAMLLIFIHGLYTGSLFAYEWERWWWIILNTMLLPCYAVHIYKDFRRTKVANGYR